jgi:proteasome lid subunit RPN8/RPN11
MIEEIKQHFEMEYPREGCGLIGIVKGKKKFFPCKNVAKDDEDFILSSEDYFRVKMQADIFAVVHSHPDDTNEASPYDIENCNHLGLPYYIFSYPEMELNIVEPKEYFQPLLGREWVFGTQDCFEAMRDWLHSKNMEIPPRLMVEDAWYDRGENYFTEEVANKWNLVKVEDTPRENDVLFFKIQSDIANHCGVYLGNDVFYHHMKDRLSCRESLHPFWYKFLDGVYRYEA